MRLFHHLSTGHLRATSALRALRPTPAHHQAAHMIGRGIHTREGAWLIASSAVTASVNRLPLVGLPLLAPLCATLQAKAILAGVSVAFPLLASPAMNVVDRYLHTNFTSRFALVQQATISQALAGRARVWKNKDIENAARQQALDGARDLAKDVGSIIAQAVNAAVTLGFAMVNFTAFISATPTMLGISIGLTIAPILIDAFAQKIRVGAERILTEAMQRQLGHNATYLDNIIIGIPEVRERWHERARTIARDVRHARWTMQWTQFLCNQAAKMPEQLPSLNFAFATAYNRLFEGNDISFSRDSMASFQGANAAVSGVFSAIGLVSSWQTIARKISIRNEVLRSIAEAPPLHSRVNQDLISIECGGSAMAPATALADLSLLGGPGIKTVRAPNGAGKTVLLSITHEHYGDASVFLPAAHSMNLNTPKGSTGQVMTSHLSYIDHLKPRPKVILLDEWNANLDAHNMALAQRMIDSWAVHSSVVQAKNRD